MNHSELTTLENVLPPAVNMTALQAAQQINTLQNTIVLFNDMVQVRIMEALYVIKNEFPNDEDFIGFVSDQTAIKGDLAINMVKTWEVSRENRELRELATSKPSEAVQLITAVYENGGVSEGDEEVIRLLSMRPKQRNKEIKALIQSRKDNGTNPASAEEISTLRIENQALIDEIANSKKIAQLKDLPQNRIQAYRQTYDAFTEELLLLSQHAMNDLFSDEGVACYAKLTDAEREQHREYIEKTTQLMELHLQTLQSHWGSFFSGEVSE